MDISNRYEVRFKIFGLQIDCMTRPSSLLFFLRFRHCFIEYNLPTNESRKPLFNALKYATSFPVIFLSAAQKIVATDLLQQKGERAANEPWHGEHPLFRLWYTFNYELSRRIILHPHFLQVIGSCCQRFILFLVGYHERLGPGAAAAGSP